MLTTLIQKRRLHILRKKESSYPMAEIESYDHGMPIITDGWQQVLGERFKK